MFRKVTFFIAIREIFILKLNFFILMMVFCVICYYVDIQWYGDFMADFSWKILLCFIINEICATVRLNKHCWKYLAKCEKISNNMFDLICKIFIFAKAEKANFQMKNLLKYLEYDKNKIAWRARSDARQT